MQARAGAIDELVASGALDDVSQQPNSDIERELAALSAGSDVDAELASMKQQLGTGEERQAIGGAADDPSAPATDSSTEKREG